MAKTPTAQCFYEFGRFRIDPIKRLLMRDGQVAPVTPCTVLREMSEHLKVFLRLCSPSGTRVQN